jgi:selenide,water dikinase
MGDMPPAWRDLLCDPQTSGGLLLAVTPEAEAECRLPPLSLVSRLPLSASWLPPAADAP